MIGCRRGSDFQRIDKKRAAANVVAPSDSASELAKRTTHFPQIYLTQIKDLSQ